MDLWAMALSLSTVASGSLTLYCSTNTSQPAAAEASSETSGLPEQQQNRMGVIHQRLECGGVPGLSYREAGSQLVVLSWQNIVASGSVTLYCSTNTSQPAAAQAGHETSGLRWAEHA